MLKVSSTNTLLRNGMLFSLFSFINRGFIFLLLLILANYIAPAEYGYLSLFSTVLMVIGYFICLSSEGYMSVSYFREGEQHLKSTFSTIFFLGVSITLLLLVIISIGGQSLANILDLPQHILFIAVFISFFTAMANVNLDYFRLKEKVKIYGLFSCSNAFLNFVLSIFLVKYCLLSWQGRVYAQIGCTALFGIYAIWFFQRRKLITFDFKHKLLPMLAWSIPIIPLHATNFLRQGLDRYIINYYHSIDDVGLFSFAMNIANIITMIGFGFNQSNSVEIYKILGDHNLTKLQKRQSLSKQKTTMFFVYLISTILITISCYFIIPLILPKYSYSMKYFLILSLYGFFVCVYLMFTNFLYFYKKTKLIMYASVGSSLLHLLLSLLLTQYSLFRTCFIYSLSQGLFAFLVMFYANRTLRSTIGES